MRGTVLRLTGGVGKDPEQISWGARSPVILSREVLRLAPLHGAELLCSEKSPSRPGLPQGPEGRDLWEGTVLLPHTVRGVQLRRRCGDTGMVCLSSFQSLVSQLDHLKQTLWVEQEAGIARKPGETWWGAKPESKARH